LSWVYSDYPTLEDAPLDLVDRLAHQLADPVEVPEEYDLAIITNQSGRSCLGTLTKGSLLFFAGERAVMVEIDRALNHHSDIRWVRLKESFLEVE
jgi:hypothetical protein